MIVIFTGPTLQKDEIRLDSDFRVMPPVKHGDILAVIPEKPDAIAIIDGYFEGAPSVWHKEILYALDRGIPVFGSSSMGALRAAELHVFGMIGVGQIFQWYRDGVICEDDEVAVLHGPEEAGFVVASVPMVNIRATLALAFEHTILDEAQRDALLDAARQIFYKQRSWRKVLICSMLLFGNKQLTDTLTAWIGKYAVDLKKRDALQLLEFIEDHCTNQSDKPACFDHFEWTQVWHAAFERHESLKQADAAISERDQRVLEQLRLQPDEYERFQDKALLRSAAVTASDHALSATHVKQTFKQFRLDNKLRSHQQLTDYMARTDLDESALEVLLESVSRVEQMRKNTENLQAEVINELKLAGRYLELLEIMEKKSEPVRHLQE